MELRQFAAGEKLRICTTQLAGRVLWVSGARDQLILEDSSGAMAVSLNLSNYPSLAEGQYVRLKANCLTGHGQAACAPLINNDGVHSIGEKAQEIFLPAGRHRVRVEWFNDLRQSYLAVEWMGPGVSRQRIPENALVPVEDGLANENGRMKFGLNYSGYEGKWKLLPDFSLLTPKKRGVAPNFDLAVRTRDEEAGLVFEGWLGVPKDGNYTFWLRSDDGSKLFIDDQAAQLEIPAPAERVTHNVFKLIPNQPIPVERSFQWVEVEGAVTFISQPSDVVRLDLASDERQLQLEVPGASFDSLKGLLGCRIRVTGILVPAERTEFCLLAPDTGKIAVVEVPVSRWADFPVDSIGSLAGRNFSGGTLSVAHIKGVIDGNSGGAAWGVTDKTGQIMIQTEQSPPRAGAEVEALGRLERTNGDLIMVDPVVRKPALSNPRNPGELPLITQAIRAKSLSAAEAKRGYPVKIRGVITSNTGGYTIQDGTWSIFLELKDPGFIWTPHIGDYVEIVGKTTNSFAPNVLVSSVEYLGKGIFPKPIQPSQDELMNGKLDTMYVELQGIASAVKSNSLILYTREGRIKLQLHIGEPEMRGDLEGAVIRVRGVISPEFDRSYQIVVSSVRLFNSSINIEEPAPEFPFAIPSKHVSDMLYFDSHASALQRVRIIGQAVYERHGEYFLMDGTYGVRFHAGSPVELGKGDLIEVVGFPDLSASSLVLRECLVRKNGHAALPVAQELTADTMLSGHFDATLVRVRATLINTSVNSVEQTLELQAGNRRFMARLELADGQVKSVLPGSQLELTGVYSGLGGGWMSRRNVDSFELLLNSAADIRVLTRPSWWTAQHILVVIGGMVSVIIGGSVWIIILRRQVEERTKLLAVEIKHREQAEYQRSLESERSRIAQDLHDDLGATLTQIGFLSTVKSPETSVSPGTRERLDEVSKKSMQMITSLDEIVWAVNPENDSLRSLATYLQHMAEEFFRTTTVNCRFDLDRSLPALPLTAEVRHNLYHTAREALNNSAKHSQATEVWLRVHLEGKVLRIVVEDNGQGFDREKVDPGGNGLINMRRRMEIIGGRFDCDSQPGVGTKYRIFLPLK